MMYHVEMKYLGIDFGLRRIGLAISEGDLAAPLKTIAVKGLIDASQKVAEFAQKEDFGRVVVGLPEGQMGKNVLGFVNTLRKKGLNVETFDETLSSKRAKQMMIELGVSAKKRRLEDAYSAAQILQDFLDSQ